jgi:hypothetical protein
MFYLLNKLKRAQKQIDTKEMQLINKHIEFLGAIRADSLFQSAAST